MSDAWLREIEARDTAMSVPDISIHSMAMLLADRRALLRYVRELRLALQGMVKRAESAQWHEDHLKQARAALASTDAGDK